jgi:hypothetical protein
MNVFPKTAVILPSAAAKTARQRLRSAFIALQWASYIFMPIVNGPQSCRPAAIFYAGRAGINP